MRGKQGIKCERHEKQQNLLFHHMRARGEVDTQNSQNFSNLVVGELRMELSSNKYLLFLLTK